MIQADPAANYMIAQDLGLDLTIVWKFDRVNGKLINHQTVPSSPGAGPRHFAFHPDGHWFYSLNEGASTLTFMTYDPTLGLLTPQEEIPTPPHAFKGTSFTSEVFVSPDGRFVYAANRLHDTIAIFAIGRTGRVTLIEMCSALSLATMTTDSPPGVRGWSPAPVRAWRSPCRTWLWDEGVVKVAAGTRGAQTIWDPAISLLPLSGPRRRLARRFS